ncbi:uncharacterized protein LOC119737683 isoform X2 [Patiria miniata]|uniref:THAP-type domain-containing protein n=1 Tax=Patiria miniata TaxID=46514 RepID=A0A914AWS4_PATMI|nr:uncharacterized protein LOC119737683 isoform X2 [Patiria miniata]
MTGCCAKGCSNRPEKGFKMHRFPRNPHRRKLWEEKVNQSHLDANCKPWFASPHAQICEVHFEGHHFEPHRVDGKRKLKYNAVPLIFGEKAQQVTLSGFRPILPIPVPMPELLPANTVPHDHAYSASATPQRMPVVFPGSDSKDSNLNADEQLHADDSDTQEDMATSDSLTADSTSDNLTKMRERIKTYQAKIHQLRREKGTILKKKNRLESSMLKMFRSDQIEALSRGGMRGIQWSKETMNMARRLWQMCGSNGYEFLLQQHYPLPSVRALQRAQEEQRASPELDEVVGTSRATLLPQEMFGSGFHN